MKKAVSIVFTFLATTFIIPGTVAQSSQRELMSTFCRPEVDELIKDSNTSFTVIYSFTVNANGRPENFRELRKSRFVDVRSAEECFSKWGFTGFERGERIDVHLYWLHGEGWKRMSVRSKKYTQLTILGEDRYGKLDSRP
jgi:hypothetical protein